MRRVQLAFLLFSAAEYGTWVAILLYAYDATGRGSVGLAAVVQLLPAAILAPFAAAFADRFRRDRVLLGGYRLVRPSPSPRPEPRCCSGLSPLVRCTSLPAGAACADDHPAASGLVAPRVGQDPGRAHGREWALGYWSRGRASARPARERWNPRDVDSRDGPHCRRRGLPRGLPSSSFAWTAPRAVAAPVRPTPPDFHGARRAPGRTPSARRGGGRSTRHRRPESADGRQRAMDVLFVLFALEVIGQGSGCRHPGRPLGPRNGGRRRADLCLVGEAPPRPGARVG